jgi:hypothetical protein
VVDPEKVASKEEVGAFLAGAKSLIDWEVALWAHRSLFQETAVPMVSQLIASLAAVVSPEEPSS